MGVLVGGEAGGGGLVLACTHCMHSGSLKTADPWGGGKDFALGSGKVVGITGGMHACRGSGTFSAKGFE